MPHTNPDATTLHILIVEDNRTQAEYLRHLLEKKGYRITVATNGFEALNMVQATNPDIILTDVMMPEMDGYSLCKKLKTDKNTSHIPIILVTHLYSPVDVIKGLEAGADNFIIKPYDPEYIFSRISSIILAKNHTKTEDNAKPLDVVFSSEVHTISSSKMQILNILLSTYETAVKNNSELQVAHERLHYTNAQLQKVVEDLQHTNESLHLKNQERERLESSLLSAQNKIDTVSDLAERIIKTQMGTAYTELKEAKKSSRNDAVREKNDTLEPSIRMEYCLKALQNTIYYLNCGVNPKKWQVVRELINAAIESVRQKQVRYENLIPEDIELYADPGIGIVIANIVSSCQNQVKTPDEIRFSFHLQENGYAIVLQDNGEGIPDRDKDVIFSLQEGQNIMPDLYLIREILSLNGFTIRETGQIGKGSRFEISCPDGSIRFSSNISQDNFS